MPGHSSIVGGSTADRLLNCPGSYQAILALPPAADRPSEYAEEGTAMHAVMAELMEFRAGNKCFMHEEVRKRIGRVFHDRELTQEHVDTMILPALEALGDLEAAYGGIFKVMAVEKSVKFPGIPGSFGTCDLILSSGSHILHVDWKFGQGIPVKAIYEDPAGDIVNPQLLFYITAAMASARHIYTNMRNRNLIGAIIQPRSDTPLSHVMITRKEIKYFAEDLQKAVVIALERDPPRKKGEWCRFAGCKIDCPLWTAPLLDLAHIEDKPRTEMVTAEESDYGNFLSRAKTLVDIVSIYKKELDEQLHAFLEDGGKVPGWRLKAKAKQRQWVDPKIVVSALERLGFESEEIFQTKLQTFQSTDATAKRRGVEIPNNLRVAPPTDETTICRTDDPAPEIIKPLAIEQFRAALAALKSA